jgi:glycosyltransferase involved in cell wall biosynthesis
MIPIFHYLRIWDVLSAGRADRIVANSSAVAARVKRWWGRKADVVHPPVDTTYFKDFVRDEPDDYYLFVGRLVHYKRADLAIKACEKLGKRLIIAGGGEEMATLKSMAGSGVEFRGRVSRTELARLYAGCKALLFPGEEDFGIVPIEAMASGRPVIAFKKGGALDYINKDNGLFFDDNTPGAMAEAIRTFEARQSSFIPSKISASVVSFEKERFKKSISDIIADMDID